jgi:ATP-dependent DNA helicase RecG
MFHYLLFLVVIEKKELAKQTGYSRSWIAETMKRLQEQGIIKRVGSDKTGHWKIIG